MKKQQIIGKIRHAIDNDIVKANAKPIDDVKTRIKRECREMVEDAISCIIPAIQFAKDETDKFNEHQSISNGSKMQQARENAVAMAKLATDTIQGKYHLFGFDRYIDSDELNNMVKEVMVDMLPD